LLTETITSTSTPQGETDPYWVVFVVQLARTSVLRLLVAYMRLLAFEKLRRFISSHAAEHRAVVGRLEGLPAACARSAEARAHFDEARDLRAVYITRADHFLDQSRQHLEGFAQEAAWLRPPRRGCARSHRSLRRPRDR
jgi:hypothetical protein